MSWINRIAKGIDNAFKFARPALNASIPPILLLCEINSRPGLSAIALASAIIRRLPEAGIETGVNVDGSPNKINMFIRIMSEEIVKEFKNNALITCGLDSGRLESMGVATSPVGPIPVSVLNTIPIIIKGLMH